MDENRGVETQWLGVRREDDCWLARVGNDWVEHDHEAMAVAERDLDAHSRHRTSGVRLNLPLDLIKRMKGDGGVVFLETRLGGREYGDELAVTLKARRKRGRVKGRKGIYRGAYYTGRSWEARDGSRYRGRYENEVEAALARDLSVMGRMVRSLNFPFDLLIAIRKSGGMDIFNTMEGQKEFVPVLEEIDRGRRERALSDRAGEQRADGAG